MAPKLKFDESVVSGRKDRKPGEVRAKPPLPSAHDWKVVVGVIMEEKKEVEEPFPTYGLTDFEENRAAELKRKLIEIHKNVTDNHLEAVLSTDENLNQWLTKITRPGYVYLSPSLDINKETVKEKNTGKTVREDLSESKAAAYRVAVDCWWWNDKEKKEHKAAVVKLVGEAQKVYGQLMDIYNTMWARERQNVSATPTTPAPITAPSVSTPTTDGSGKKAKQGDKTQSAATPKDAKPEPTKELSEDDYSVFSNWLKAYKTRQELINWRTEQKTKLNRDERGRLAIKRLMRDLRDCDRFPIPGIAAAPVAEDDLRYWHCNIQAPPDHPWAGRVFHISMQFGQTYPEEPPIVKALTPIRHPNVFGQYICLDMLCAPGSRFQVEEGVTGWTSAYSVQSILLQLQAFLLSPSFVKELVPDKAQWLKKNADGIAYNRYDSSGKPYPPEELKKIKKDAYDRAYYAAFSHVWNEDSYEARLLKQAAKYKCDHCGHSRHYAKPQCPSYDTAYQPPAAALAAAAVAAPAVAGAGAAGGVCPPTGGVCPPAICPPTSSSASSSSSSSAPSSSPSSSAASLLSPEPKLTPATLFSTLLSAEAPDSSPAPLTPKPAAPEARVPLDTTTSGPWALAPGDLLIGVVTQFVYSRNEPQYAVGALVDVKWEHGRDGLVHISQLPRLKDPTQRIEDPSEVVSIGQKVTVRVTAVDDLTGRLSLSMRPETPAYRGPRTPRDRNSENGCEGAPPVGTVCVGTVKDVKERIAFIDIGAKRDGKLDLPFPLLSRAEKRNGGVEYLWWDVAKVLKSHIGQKIRVQVDQLEDRPNLILPPNVQCSGTSNRPRATATSFVPGTETKERTSLDELCDNESLLMLTLGYLSRAELHVWGSQRPHPDPVTNRIRMVAPIALATEFLKNDLVCFHSRVTFDEEMLGVGLNLEYYPNSGDLSNISPNLDLISENAFHFEKVRTGVWQQPFTHWLPLYLSARHAGNLERHEQAIAEIARNKALSNTKVVFHPPMVLKVLPSLLNTMIVEIMKGKTHESEVALQGYLSFYHLFLAFTIKYPELQKEIDNRVKVFLESERGRMKRVCPNLGEWLACLACSSYSWKQVAVAAITEVFDRNVKWTVMEYPELVNLRELEDMEALEEEKEDVAAPVTPVPPPQIATTPVAGLSKAARRRLREKKGAAWEAVLESSKPASQVKVHVQRSDEPDTQGLKLDRGRLPKTWKVTQVSSRLVMFHVLFLRMFRLAPANGKSEEDEDMEVSLLSIEQTKRKLDQSYGRATHRITQVFQRSVKRILDTPDWAGFFTRCLLPVPDPNFLCRWLQRAALNSARKRYHDAEAVNKALDAIKAENKAKRDAAKAALDPLAHFDEDERAALGKGFMDHDKHSSKYDKYENTRNSRWD